MPLSKDSWNLDCCYLRAHLHKKGWISCSKPKELFLQLQEELQENEPDHSNIAQRQHGIQCTALQREPFYQLIVQELREFHNNSSIQVIS